MTKYVYAQAIVQTYSINMAMRLKGRSPPLTLRMVRGFRAAPESNTNINITSGMVKEL